MPREDQKPGMDNAAYNVGYGGSMAASQFRMIAQRDRSAPPSTPSDHTSGQYQRASGPNRYGGTNDESTLGLENGWKHLRHTPAKRFRIEQEKREERSKLGGWTGFSKTIESFPETPGKSGGKQDDSLTTFNPMFDTRGRKGHELIPPVAASEQQRSGIVRQPEENLEFGHRWGRSKEGRRAEKFAEPDEYEELDNLAKTPNPRTDVRNRGRKSDLSRSKRVDDDDFDIEAFEIARAKRRARMRQDDALKKERELAAPKPIAIPDFISVVNLGILMGIRPEAFRGKLEDLGFSEATNDHILDSETAGLIAAEFNFEPVVADPTNADLVAQPPVEDQSSLLPRPPVVTIMGHVDHGKTTILDYLRKSSVAASEHGGITQHIGAFSVPMPSGKLITFLDTPGHAAFLDMRRRGANMTDIVILVVAGDDSVKPQTIEAIKHIKEANVATIVAINKIDKEDANAERVKQDLSREGIAVEDYGGEVQAIPVSGKTGQGMPDLEEAAVALSDMLDMRADRSGFAEGWVIEASTKRAGRVATVLVRRGTLRPGNIIVAGMTWARVKGLKNEAGVSVSEAGPGTPVEVDGWKDQPVAGDEVLQAPSEARAKAAIDVRLEKQERGQLMTDILAINDARRVADEKRTAKLEAARKWKREHPDEWVRKIHDEGWQEIEKTSGVKEVAFIAKADVSGSVEAVVNSVAALGNAEVRANVLRSGVGPISAFDVEHAAAAEGHILNFNTTVDPNIARMAEMEGVEIFDHNIIYKLVDAVKAKLSDQLEPLVINKVTGEAEIGQVFDIKVKGKVTMAIAGCKVRNGVISRSSKVRVLRGKDIIFDGMCIASFRS
jgi:translation initiation factor IF-2